MNPHDLVDVSFGATPYIDQKMGHSFFSFNDPYYDSPLYVKFLDSVKTQAERFGVAINSTHRAVGIFQGAHEPSAAIAASGRRIDIERIAVRICKEFDQQAVRVIYQPGHGQHLLYSFPVGEQKPEDVVRTLKTLGVTGGRITNGQLEIANITSLSTIVLNALEKVFGQATILPCEVVTISNE